MALELMLQGPVYQLSGGWRMKLASCVGRTNPAAGRAHQPFDVRNVAWVENYLTNLKDVTVVAVSHSAGFLDHVCTSIIHFSTLKLKKHK